MTFKIYLFGKTFWTVITTKMGMYRDQYLYDHEDQLMLQIFYYNKNIYNVFSRKKRNLFNKLDQWYY